MHIFNFAKYHFCILSFKISYIFILSIYYILHINCLYKLSQYLYVIYMCCTNNKNEVVRIYEYHQSYKKYSTYNVKLCTYV